MKLGKIDTGKIFFYKVSSGKYRDGTFYCTTPYISLWLIARYLKLKKDDIFMDLGCGTGRVVFFFATKRIKKAIGIDTNKKLIKVAKKNLSNFSGQKNKVEFWNSDAATFDMSSPTIFFFYNPFGEKTFKKVLENIRKSLDKNPRKIRIVYRNPVCKNLLNTQKWLKYRGKMSLFMNVCFWSN
jgi:precorrin-6B methylase 2